MNVIEGGGDRPVASFSPAELDRLCSLLATYAGVREYVAGMRHTSESERVMYLRDAELLDRLYRMLSAETPAPTPLRAV